MAEASGDAADEALGAAAEGGGEQPREFDITTLERFVSQSNWPELEKYLKLVIGNKSVLDNQPDEDVILRHASLFLHCRRGQLSVIQREGHQHAVSYLEQYVKPLRESTSVLTNVENLNQIIHGIAESVENNQELMVDAGNVMDAINDYLRLNFLENIGEFDITTLQQLVSQRKWHELEEYLKVVIENRSALDNQADEDVILRHASLFLHCRRGRLSLIQHEGHQQAVNYLEQSVKPLRESASEFTNTENLNQTIHGIAESVENNEQLIVDTSAIMDAMTDYLRLYFPEIIGHDPKQPHNPSKYHDFVLSIPEGTNQFRCLMCQHEFDTRPTNFFKPHIRQCRNVTKNVTNRLDRLMLLEAGKGFDIGQSGKRKRTVNGGQSYSLGDSNGHQNKGIGGLVDTATKLLSDLAAEYHQLERNPDRFGKAHLELEKVLASIRAKASSSEQAGQSSLLGGACFQPGAQVLQQGTSNYCGFQASLPTGVPSLHPLLQQQLRNYETAQQQHVFTQQQQQQFLLLQQQQQQWVLQQQQNQQALQQHQNQQLLQQHQNQHQHQHVQLQHQPNNRAGQQPPLLQQQQHHQEPPLLQQQQHHQEPPLLQQQQHHQEPPLNNQGAPLVPLDPGSPGFNLEDFLLDDELLLEIEEPGLPQEQLMGGPLPQQPPVLQQLAVPAPPQPPVPPQQQNQS